MTSCLLPRPTRRSLLLNERIDSYWSNLFPLKETKLKMEELLPQGAPITIVSPRCSHYRTLQECKMLLSRAKLKMEELLPLKILQDAAV